MKCLLSLFIFLFPVFIFFNNLCVYFWLCWVFIAAWPSLSLRQVGTTLQLQCMGFSLQRLFLLWRTGSRMLRLQELQRVGSVAVTPGLQGTGCVVVAHKFSCHMWALPGSGIEPMSPAVAGSFFTTEPPGKPFLSSC